MAVHSANSDQVSVLSEKGRYAIDFHGRGVNGRLSPSFRGYKNVRCRGLTPPLKGTVVAKKKNGLLIVFNKDEYQRICGDKLGVNDQPMLWIYGPLNVVRKANSKSVSKNSHGDVSSAVQSIARQKKATGLGSHRTDKTMNPVGYSGGQATQATDLENMEEVVENRYILPSHKQFKIKMNTSGVRGRLTSKFSGKSNIGCKSLKRNMRGTVVARKGNGILIAFNPDDWKRACGDQEGVLGHPLAWVYEPRNFVRKIKGFHRRGSFGQTEIAKAALVDDPPPTPPVAPSQAKTETDCDCEDGKKGTSGLADVTAAISSGDLDRRCFDSNGQPDVENGGFKAILKRAQAKGWNRKCKDELQRIACEESPWKGLGLKDRFDRIFTLGKKHAQRYGVDARAMPCIAGAETGSLEPQLKVFHTCYKKDHKKYTAQGIGQMTRTTFRAYFKRGGAGLGPYRSQIPPFNAPPFTENPDLLFDAMGTSVELQLEIMAYTLKEKKRRSKDWTMFFRYHGVSKGYANAANRCMSCLKTRIDQNGRKTGTKDPAQCLSYVARTVVNKKQVFYKKADNKIYRSFKDTLNKCERLKQKNYTPLCGGTK